LNGQCESDVILVFDLPGGKVGDRGGLTRPLHVDDLLTGTCLGGRLWPPEGFQKQLGKTRGTKNFLLALLADYLCPNV